MTASAPRTTSAWMTPELESLRDQFGRFLDAELKPHAARWRRQRMIDRSAWTALGGMGALGAAIPEEWGGSGGDVYQEMVLLDTINRRCSDLANGYSVHSGIVTHYVLTYGTEDQKRRWLPKLCSGEWIGAIAMTEPGGGSDLQALTTRGRRDGDDYVIDGQKTFITNGIAADLVLVAVRIDGTPGAKGISLIGVEKGAPGFQPGRPLEKIGLHAADTAELFFDGARAPVDNLLGGIEGRGFYQMMEQLPRERLILAIGAVAAMEHAVEITRAYVHERKAFGKTLFDFQTISFRLAELATEAHIARVFVDDCLVKLAENRLDNVTASMAKWWCSERQVQTVDACLQMFGGYGYIEETEIARMYTDARIQKIYGGANEIMKLLIARSL
ncbi:MAG: acyl-CoA dehydrogenase [Tistrella sp.]|uniref:Acyl-CoA dehydrogenase n=1 Tax=Tistrella mobilis TaxID=171437 RepID=A0A3B9IS29_9PROT|nr:acyl-CoA dehydrogenase family protein [Tistrella sp.]MAD38268.1 acyl-CoA dehydrogenase [Tistrella sp.]MBA73845.1 acyl-CoA dehydrogenase [Tistrella sp.]HAE50147.1 acyl-CoA dehydrogenase [Tistrella mobilis]